MTIKHSFLMGIAIFTMTATLPLVANAQNTHAQDAQQTTTQDQQQTAPQQTAADHRAAAQTRLAAAKLRACENRQKAITNIMTRIADRGQKQLDLFSTIATRAETFYTTKGKTLANYDTLVADVATQKAAAQTVVSDVTTASTTFDCSSNDPKGMVSSFKDSLMSEIAALKAYKTSVKNLIVGIKSVESTTASTNGGKS